MRPPRLIPLYLLLICPFLATSRPTYAMQPAQDGAAVQRRINEALKQGATVIFETEDNRASGTGAGINAQGTEIDVAGKGSAPESQLTGVGSGKGGSHETTLHAETIVENAKWIGLLVVGALFILAGVGTMSAGLRRVSFTLFGVGACFVAAAFLGVWFWIALVVAAIGVGGVLVYAELAKKGSDAGKMKLLKGLHDAENDHANPHAKEAAKTIWDYVEAHGDTAGAIAINKARAKLVARLK